MNNRLLLGLGLWLLTVVFAAIFPTSITQQSWLSLVPLLVIISGVSSFREGLTQQFGVARQGWGKALAEVGYVASSAVGCSVVARMMASSVS